MLPSSLYESPCGGLVTPVDLLLEHDAVDARLQEREDETRLPFEFSQPIEDVGAGRPREVIKG
jgi:hypothetical protein